MGAGGRRALPEYFWSSLFASCPPAARLASPDGAGRVAWYDGVGDSRAGFYDNAAVRDYLRRGVYSGRSAAERHRTSATSASGPTKRW